MVPEITGRQVTSWPTATCGEGVHPSDPTSGAEAGVGVVVGGVVAVGSGVSVSVAVGSGVEVTVTVGVGVASGSGSGVYSMSIVLSEVPQRTSTCTLPSRS